MAFSFDTGRSDRPSGGLEIAVRHCGQTMVVELAGELDLATARRVRNVLLEAFQQDPEFVALDLSRLTFIDATGIRATVQAGHQAAAQGVHLAIIPGPPAVQRVFAMCGITTAGDGSVVASRPWPGWSDHPLAARFEGDERHRSTSE